MVKKILLMLVLTLIAVGGVFAQTNFASMPKNTFTVDVGPTIVGLAFGQIGKYAEKALGDEVQGDFNTSGIGVGAQYERQLFSVLGVAARGAYMKVGYGYTDSFSEAGVTANASVKLDLTAISAEGHARFYPFTGRTFFLGGMGGYGSLIIDTNGDIVVRDENSGQLERESVTETIPRSYIKLGARLGWRIDFGRPGGFVFEPSLGYNYAIGLGKTFGKRLEDKIGEEISDIGEFEDVFKIIENYVFMGGPRVSLAFGWRF